jgi:hypothetical protein
MNVFFVITYYIVTVIKLQKIYIYTINAYFEGILSFLSAPLIGALSDIWGRKFFLLGRGSSLFAAVFRIRILIGSGFNLVSGSGFNQDSGFGFGIRIWNQEGNNGPQN